MLAALGRIRLAPEQTQHERHGRSERVARGLRIGIPTRRTPLERRQHVQRLTRAAARREHAHYRARAIRRELQLTDLSGGVTGSLFDWSYSEAVRPLFCAMNRTGEGFDRLNIGLVRITPHCENALTAPSRIATAVAIGNKVRHRLSSFAAATSCSFCTNAFPYTAITIASARLT